MNLDAMLASIPYLTIHDLTVETDPDGAVHVGMPACQQLTNHVGTFHAGALYTAAETAAGIAAFQTVPRERAVVLLRGATIRYTRRAESDVTATAQVERERGSAACAAFDATGRAEIDVSVTAVDSDDAIVFEGDFNYALRSRKP